MALRLLSGCAAMGPSRSEPNRLHVAIVSKNSETRDGLEAYLRQSGLTTSGTSEIDRATSIGRDAAATVVFPDDFEWDAVVGQLNEFKSQNPRALLVLVTRTPQRFAALPWSDDGPLPSLVPKPAWGWTILDTIRAHLREQPELESDS